jgi:hypothetical protein
MPGCAAAVPRCTRVRAGNEQSGVTQNKILTDSGTVYVGSGKSEYYRMFKEMNFLSAHRSSNPICPATESVSAVGFPGVRRIVLVPGTSAASSADI